MCKKWDATKNSLKTMLLILVGVLHAKIFSSVLIFAKNLSKEVCQFFCDTVVIFSSSLTVSLFPAVSLSLSLSVSLSVSMSTYVNVSVCVCALSIFLSLSVSLAMYLSVYVSLSIYLSVSLPLSVCLFVSLSLSCEYSFLCLCPCPCKFPCGKLIKFRILAYRYKFSE